MLDQMVMFPVTLGNPRLPHFLHFVSPFLCS